jgi:hypothetical protein
MIRSKQRCWILYVLTVVAISSSCYFMEMAFGSSISAKNNYCKSEGKCTAGILVTLAATGTGTDGCTESGSTCTGTCYGAAGATSGMVRTCAAKEGSTCYSDTGYSKTDCGDEKSYSCTSGKQGPSGCCNYDGQSGTLTGNTAKVTVCDG